MIARHDDHLAALLVRRPPRPLEPPARSVAGPAAGAPPRARAARRGAGRERLGDVRRLGPRAVRHADDEEQSVPPSTRMGTPPLKAGAPHPAASPPPGTSGLSA